MRTAFLIRRSRVALACLVALAAAWGLPGARAGETLEANDDVQPLAWIRFDDGPEAYADRNYHWLGRNDLAIRVEVPPARGHALELLWGSKNDQRGASLVVNGAVIRVQAGGYAGYRWLRVPLPPDLPGTAYEFRLTRDTDKPAFLAEVRLVGDGSPSADADLAAAAYRMQRTLLPPSAAEAFPEMRAQWDRPLALPDAATRDPHTAALLLEAEQNGRRATEMFFRCRKFVEGWLAQADPASGLIPRNLTASRDIWNAKDSAADNYPYMVLTAALTDRELFEGRMRDMLRTETRLTSRVGRLPDTWKFSTQAYETAEPDLQSIIFGGAEYVKDGLLPLTEWLGPSPWSERMTGIVDDILANARVETPVGDLATLNVEVNGDLLQALSRLYWFTGERKYLDAAERLGDYYLLGDHHPSRDFTRLQLRDHGCEIVAGLSELYVAVHFAHPEKKREYEEPLHALFDRVLEAGRNDVGMLYNWINPQTGEHDRGFCDTWGYNYNGLYALYLVDGTAGYREAVQHVLSQLEANLTDYHWGSADEYADSIEGAINLVNREPCPSAARWIDSEIRDMWSVQKPDGVVEGWHGDGNSARTAIMYALWKSRGVTPRPWHSDLQWGAAQDGEKLYLVVASRSPWKGCLIFDRARHRLQMRLPIDYPRINQFPEWFTADGEAYYRVSQVGTAESQELPGKKLWEGLPIDLRPEAPLCLVVEPVKR